MFEELGANKESTILAALVTAFFGCIGGLFEV
jgi:hypothetical protein